MKLFLKKSDFYSQNKMERIFAVCKFIETLEFSYELKEMPKQALKVYFLVYFVNQVNNGGFCQFIHNSQFKKIMINGIYSCLLSINCNKIREIFKKSCDLMEDLSKEDFEQFMCMDIYSFYSNEFNNQKIIKTKEELEALDSEFYNENRGDKIFTLCYEYIGNFKDVEIVDDYIYELKMNELLNKNENKRELFIKNLQDTMPDILKIIKEVIIDLCNLINIEFVSIGLFDNGHFFVASGKCSVENVKNNIKNNIDYFYITTNKGLYYVITDKDKAAIFNDETNKMLASIYWSDKNYSYDKEGKTNHEKFLENACEIFNLKLIAIKTISNSHQNDKLNRELAQDKIDDMWLYEILTEHGEQSIAVSISNPITFTPSLH